MTIERLLIGLDGLDVFLIVAGVILITLLLQPRRR